MTQPEWEQEPDKLDYIENEWNVAIRRHPELKHLCGYVGIPDGHPLYGLDYEDYPLNVHGGLTYGRAGNRENLPEGFWWIGFDCSHAWDFSPGLGELLSRGAQSDEVYRNIDYVKSELWDLTWELSKLSKLCWQTLENYSKKGEKWRPLKSSEP